jgi:predicted chitinase
VTRPTDTLAAVVAMYHDQAIAAAEAEAEHKKYRAKRFLKALHDEEAKSAVMAENIAEADDTVADLYSKRLITAAIADSTKQKIMSLKEEIGYERSLMADRRVADEMHARDRSVT